MKYYKLENQIFAFEADGSQDDFIKPEMVKMTADDIDRHINPDTYLSDAERHEQYINSLRPLTRRQFKLALLDNNLLDSIEAAIAGITDAALKARIAIEYTESTEFVRTSESVLYMCNLLSLTDEQINAIWEQAEKI